MAQFNDEGFKTFTTSEAVVRAKTAKMTTTADTASLGGAGDYVTGIWLRDAASGSEATVALRNKPGTHAVMVDSSTSVGDVLYAAASGKMSKTQCGTPQMMAVTAASADGDIIEAVFLPNGFDRKQFTVKTAAYTVTRQETGAIFSNLGAAGAVTFTLPQDAVKGDYFTFVAQTAQEVRVDPGAAGGIYVSGAKQTDDAYVSFDDEAEHITVVADGNGDWVVINSAGTLTVV